MASAFPESEPLLSQPAPPSTPAPDASDHRERAGKKLSIVVPMHNEAEVLDAFFTRIDTATADRVPKPRPSLIPQPARRKHRRYSHRPGPIAVSSLRFATALQNVRPARIEAQGTAEFASPP